MIKFNKIVTLSLVGFDEAAAVFVKELSMNRPMRQGTEKGLWAKAC